MTTQTHGTYVGQGEGTLWERWEGDLHTHAGSRNHIMLGGFDGPYFFGNLAGLQQSAASRAWDDVIVQPTVAGELAGVSATLHTLRGPLTVEWNVRSQLVRAAICCTTNRNAAAMHRQRQACLSFSVTRLACRAGTLQKPAKPHATPPLLFSCRPVCCVRRGH